jgi:opacity protein-like surface antigen
MRKTKLLAAAVTAASVLSTAAMAADLPIAPPPVYMPPPPPAEFGGWYLRGDIGFSNQSIGSIRSTNAALYAPVTSLQQTSEVNTAGIFDLGVGYKFNNWFRADVIGQYRGAAKFSGLDQISGSGFVGTDAYTGTKSEWLVLASAYVDLGTWWCITPFIGAGIGMANVNIRGFTDTGDLYNGWQNHSFAYSSAASQWNFAWAVHAGLAYQVNPGLSIELAYSYVNMGQGLTGPTQLFDGSLVNGHPFAINNITSNDLKIGMRWMLDQPAPAPLMTRG